MNVHYVYALLDPRKNNLPFYIGYGCGTRCFQHTAPSNLLIGINPFKDRTINAILRAGMRPKAVKLFEGLSKEAAAETETALILLYGRRARDPGGILTNLAPGGEGNFGYRWTDEQRQRASEQRKGRGLHENTRASIRERNSELVWTDEMRDRVSRQHAGKTLTPDHRDAFITAGSTEEAKRNWRVQVFWNQLTGKRASHPMKGKKVSPERREQLHKAAANQPEAMKRKRRLTWAWKRIMRDCEYPVA